VTFILSTKTNLIIKLWLGKELQETHFVKMEI